MSLHPLPWPGPATIAVEQQFPSLPLDPEPLSREHSKQAWALGSELVQESSQQGWPSANPQPRPVLSMDQTFSVTKAAGRSRSEEHTSELQSLTNLVCRLLLEKKKQQK